MSVIETLTADPHRECRDRADALTGMLATLYTLACVGDYQELTDFIRRRRLDDKAIGKLLDRVEAAERSRPWSLADKDMLAALNPPEGAVILDADGIAWQLRVCGPDSLDPGRHWGNASWSWTEGTPDPDNCGPLFPVQMMTRSTQTWEAHRGYVEHGGSMPVDRDAIADDAWRASLEQELKTARDAVSRARREATA